MLYVREPFVDLGVWIEEVIKEKLRKSTILPKEEGRQVIKVE